MASGQSFASPNTPLSSFHYWSVGRGIVLASAARIGLAAAFDQDLIPERAVLRGRRATRFADTDKTRLDRCSWGAPMAATRCLC